MTAIKFNYMADEHFVNALKQQIRFGNQRQ